MELIKKIKHNADSYLLVLIVLGIIVALNFFSYQFSARRDLTADQRYSISPASQEFLAGLDDIVSIKVYFSEKLPSQYLLLRQQVKDIIDEYVHYSGGKVKVEFIDPIGDEDLMNDLYALGIPPLQFNILEKDKYEVTQGYLGMAISHKGKQEVIPVVETADNLEYQLSLAIKKTSGQEKVAIGILSGRGALDKDNGLGVAYEQLSELYALREINIETEAEIPSSIKTLIIAGPREEFSEDELRAIDKFFSGGGYLLVLLDGVNVEGNLQASPNTTGLEELLSHYGIKVNQNLILDTVSSVASFNQGFVVFNINYPFWPKIVKEGFNKEEPAVANLESLILPWVSSLESAALKVEQAENLVLTSDGSWQQESENFDLNPTQNFVVPGKTQPYAVAISLGGQIISAYDENRRADSRLIVVGDSDFINDNFLRTAPDNLVFFQNLVDSLNLDEDLINIRSKGIVERPIKELSDKERLTIRYANVLGVAVLVIIIGLLRYYFRKRKNK